MEEHQVKGEAYGIILDGTGFGLDGNIWGFEVLYGDVLSFKRMAHLHYTPLPGGEKCIREPWRNAAAMLISLLGAEGETLAKTIFNDKRAEIDTLKMMIDRNINTVYAGTCGRLFDAVSALCGVTKISSYDGEAAIQLAELADENNSFEPYLFDFVEQDVLTIDFSKMLKEIALEILAERDVSLISGRFHETVAQATVEVMEKLLVTTSNANKQVVLSGGSFHNRFLRKRLTSELIERGFAVFVPEQVPCNDGGLSYGQLAIAKAKRSALQCV
jgi:hydrogenase maturation protein HypF